MKNRLDTGGCYSLAPFKESQGEMRNSYDFMWNKVPSALGREQSSWDFSL